MRCPCLAAFLGATLLATAAAAQTQPQASQNEAAECDRLIAFLDPHRPTAGVTVERAREWKRASDAAACRAALNRLTQASVPPFEASPPGAPGSGTERTRAQLDDPSTGYGTHPAPGAAAGPPTTGALAPAATRPVPASELRAMTLYDARESKLGEVAAVVSGTGGQTFLIVGSGGFLGLGEKRVAVPLDRLALRGGRLVADRLTDDELRNLPAYDRDGSYREMDGNQSAPIRVVP